MRAIKASKKNGWIGVDLDGTLAYYDGWVHETHIGDPIPAMLARVKQWLREGIDVRIFTARISNPERNSVVIPVIENYCKKHLGQVLPITNVKDFDMTELWDDRAVGVIQNTGIPKG